VSCFTWLAPQKSVKDFTVSRRYAAADSQSTTAQPGDNRMGFVLYYVAAISILALHFTGFLARHNLEWLILALAATVFPAVFYL
jgi:hypothetical protein